MKKLCGVIIVLLLLASCATPIAETQSGKTHPRSTEEPRKATPKREADNTEIAFDSTTEPPLDEAAKLIAVPEFLSQEQQLLYRRAYCLYMSMFGGDTTGVDMIGGVSPRQGLFKSVTIGETTYLLSQGRYAKWEEFDAVVRSVFTEAFWNGKNQFDGERELFTSYEGKLCFIEASRGVGYYYNANFPDEFRLEEMTDTVISFKVIGHYSPVWPLEGETPEMRDQRRQNEYEYTLEFPIKMVLTDAGWRIDSFYSALADERAQ